MLEQPCAVCPELQGQSPARTRRKVMGSRGCGGPNSGDTEVAEDGVGVDNSGDRCQRKQAWGASSRRAGGIGRKEGKWWRGRTARGMVCGDKGQRSGCLTPRTFCPPHASLSPCLLLPPPSYFPCFPHCRLGGRGGQTHLRQLSNNSVLGWKLKQIYTFLMYRI